MRYSQEKFNKLIKKGYVLTSEGPMRENSKELKKYFDKHRKKKG